MSFDEFCRSVNATPGERRALALYLASDRYERLLDILLGPRRVVEGET